MTLLHFNLCNIPEGSHKNVHSSNYMACHVIGKQPKDVSHIAGVGSISNFIIITIVQSHDNDDESLTNLRTEWLNEGLTDWRTEGLKDWRTDWLTPGSAVLTTCLLPRRHLAMTLPCNCMPLLGSGIGWLRIRNPGSIFGMAKGTRRRECGGTGRLLGVCHVVYWPVCVLPVHIWIFVAILMNFQPRLHGAACQATRYAGTGCDNESGCESGLRYGWRTEVIVWAVIMAILVRDDALGYLVIWANQAIYSQLSSTLQLCGNRYALLF